MKPSKLVLRSAQLRDIDAIHELELSGFDQAIVETREVFLERIAAFANGFLVLEDPESGRIIAYACSEIWPQNLDYLHDHAAFKLGHDIRSFHQTTGTSLYLASMTIAPEYRGRGLGHAFFRQCIAHMHSNFPGLKKAILIVCEAWENAIRIYTQAGFVQTGYLPDFFDNSPVGQRHALIMERNLPL